MNWTGGRLQQSKKNIGKSGTNRQKQHFASVRQRLQNGASSPQMAPFRPSFLLSNESGSTSAFNPIGLEQRHVNRPNAKQRKVDDYRSTAPLARRLASIKERPGSSIKTESRTVSGREYRDEKYEIRQSTLLSHQKSLHSPDRRPKSVRSLSSGHKRRHIQQSVEGDSLEVQRRKLLEQSDWVGLAPSRPLHMKFSSLKDKEKIGKRRRIDHDRARKTNEQGGRLNEQGNVRAQFHGRFMNGALGGLPESISVRIGDEALESQMCAIPQQALDVRTSANLERQRSDTMLMDFDVEHENVGQETQPAEPFIQMHRQSSDAMLFDIELQQCSHRLQEWPQQHYSDTEEIQELNVESDRELEEASVHNPIRGEAHHSIDSSGRSPYVELYDGLVEVEGDEMSNVINQIRSSDSLLSQDLQDVRVAGGYSPSSHVYPTMSQLYRLIFDSSPTESLNDQPELISHSHKECYPETEVKQPMTRAESAWKQFLFTSTSLACDTVPDADSELESNKRVVVRAEREHKPNDRRAVHTVKISNLKTPATESSPSVAVNTTAIRGVEPTQCIDEGVSKEELWRRFVFGNEAEESTPPNSPGDEEIAQSLVEPVARSLASSLFVGVSTSSFNAVTDSLRANVDMGSYQYGPSCCVSTMKTSRGWEDRSSDPDLNEASVKDSDAPRVFRPAAEPRYRKATSSLAHASMYNNTLGSRGLSTDTRGTADTHNHGEHSTSIEGGVQKNSTIHLGS